jgi:hypothetical protein
MPLLSSNLGCLGIELRAELLLVGPGLTDHGDGGGTKIEPHDPIARCMPWLVIGHPFTDELSGEPSMLSHTATN